MNDTAKDLIYLLSCAVNGITPDTARVQAMDLESLYRLAKAHTLRAAVYIALRSAGVSDYNFQQAYNKAVRKNVMLDLERTAILAEFEKQGIWYMPLKGALLKELYPENGMREMSDNDILFDVKFRKETREIMLARGYKAEHYGTSHCDEYLKPPIYNYELHNSFFTANQRSMQQYYINIGQKLIKDTDNGYGFHFSDEDFYVYMIAHEYKHYSGGGTGLRSLLDSYVFLRHKSDALDWHYINEQTKQLKIADFERNQRELSEKVFSSPALPELADSEQEMLDYYLTSHTYGTVSRAGENAVKKGFSESANKSKLTYLWRRVFPDLKHMETWFPFFYRHKLLLPIGYLWRIIRAPFIRDRKNRIKAELKALNKYDNKKI